MKFTTQQILDWRAYEKVRSGGKWNMITHAAWAARDARLPIARYMFVLKNYEALAHEATRKG